MFKSEVISRNFCLVITCALALFILFSSAFGQQHKKLVVIAHVIGVEQPERDWPMEYESVKIFYLRIEKVLSGKTNSKYIRVAYGYNPSSSPQYILPKEMFEGKNRWKFELSEYKEFDKKVSVSKSEGDWMDMKNSRKVKGREFLPENDPDAAKEFTTIPITPKCVAVAGYEKEATALETLDIVKGYWLSFEGKRFKKL